MPNRIDHDIIRQLVAHEQVAADLGGVVEQAMLVGRARGKADIISRSHDVVGLAYAHGQRPFQNEHMLFFMQMIMRRAVLLSRASSSITTPIL